jgi:hypothetical protein
MRLTRLLSGGMLDRLADPESYRPKWAASDREMWNRVPDSVRDFWVARAERYRNFPWPPLEPLYADFQTTGNRQRFEAVYHRRRQVITTFVLAEALEHHGRFIEALLDAIVRVADEPTWVLPAHEQHAIDLFSAETANLFAWVLYLFRTEPALARSAVAVRAAAELRARVIEPYLSRDDFWWMALDGQTPGNWTTWCTSNCLGAVLLIETDKSRRAAAVAKACRSLDRFVEAYAEDGGCDEGPMYWNFAAGCLFDSLEMLHEASGGAVDLFGDPAIRRLGAYITKVHVHDLRFVNFADSPPEVPVDGALLYRFGTRVGDASMRALGAHLYRLLDRFDPEDTLRLKIYRTLATLAECPSLRDVPGPTSTPRASYLPRLQLAVAREHPRAGDGLLLAAKGGHNGELHNHNDVGTVTAHLDGRPVLIDVGMKQYAKDTFTDRRYEIWAMRSDYHNVPLVNGCVQMHGADSGARDATFIEGDDEVTFGVDIAEAYPAAAGLVRWQRTSVLSRNEATIHVRDEFCFNRSDNRYEQRFMTASPPRVVDGEVVLEIASDRSAVLRSTPRPDRITLHAFALRDSHLQRAWGDTLYQIRLHFERVAAQGRCDVSLVARNGRREDASRSDVAYEWEALP